MTYSTLFYMKMKQGINSLFIFSNKGWGLVFFELLSFVSLIYVIKQQYLYTMNTALLLCLAFIILLGSNYLSAEKYLSCAENRSDLLTGIPAKQIIWAVYGQIICSSLRVMNVFPLILAASSKTISLWLISLTFLVFPFTAALLAGFFNILINRYLKSMAAAFYLLFSFLWGGAITILLVFLLTKYKLSFITIDNYGTVFILILLSVVSITILRFSSNLSVLWREAYLLNNAMNKTRLPFKRFEQFSRWSSSTFMAKEWFLLMRNAITKVRFMVWAALIIICSFTGLKTYLYQPSLFVIISLIIWLFCYGELPATAWQNEGEQKSFYWLSGFKPSQLIAAKIAAFLPLSLFAIFTALFLGLAIQLSFTIILQRAGLVFWLTAAGIILSLAIAGLGHNGSKQVFNNAMLEQVPLTISAIISVGMEFLFCCIAFLPWHWMLFLSIAIPGMCLIAQTMWLQRNYYANRQACFPCHDLDS